MNSSLTNSSSLVLFVCGSPRRFTFLPCRKKLEKKLVKSKKRTNFSLFLFFSLSFGQNKNFTLTKAFLPFYDDAERRRQTTRRRQRQRRTEEEEEESETKEEEEEEDINNNVSKSAS